MKRFIFLFLFFSILSSGGWSQSEGDYRSHQSGNWNVIANWEKYISGTWVYPSPDYPLLEPSRFTSKVSILNGHTITVTSGNVQGTSSASLEIASGGTLNMGSYSIRGYRSLPWGPIVKFPSLLINGTLNTAGDVTVDVLTVGSSGYFNTSYVGTYGWWVSDVGPTSVTLNGSVNFSGGVNQLVPPYTYYNIIISGTSTKLLNGAVTISNDLTIISGAGLSTNGKSLTITGSGIQNSGQFLASAGGTVTFSGTTQSISGTGSYAFPNLVISSAGSTTLNAAISTANLTINDISGTAFDINGRNVTINGTGIVINGLLSDSQGTGTIIMNTGPQNISGANTDITFSNLRIAGTSTTLQSDITVTGLLTINATRTLNLNGKTTYIEGSGITLNGTLNAGTDPVLYFDGGDQTISGTGSFSGILMAVGIGMNSASNTNVTLYVTDTLRTNYLYIEENSFTISPDSKVEIYSGLDNFTENGLVLQSSATSSASLLLDGGTFPYYGGNQKIKVERYMTNDKKQIVSPSITDQDIQVFFTNNPSIPTRDTEKNMRIFDEPSHLWVYLTTSTTGYLSAGTGYLIKTNSNGPIYCSGVINYMDKQVPVSRLLYGWNCIGNPYTTAIGITTDAISSENFLTVNASKFSPNYGAIYIWDEPDEIVSGANYYKIISNSGFTPPSGTKTTIDQDYVQSGQGFLVRVNDFESSFDFTTDMQCHGNTMTFFKSSESSWPGIRLYVRSGNKSYSTDIAFHKNMTKGLDVTFDAGLMGGISDFGIYTRLVEDNGIDFGVQCLPDTVSGNMVIPIGLVCKDASVVTFSADIVPLPDGYSAILEDRQLDVFTDLTRLNAKYDVSLPANTSGIGRFFLHTSYSATGLLEENIQKITTYAVGKEIFIRGRIDESTIAVLYDLYGKKLKTKILESSDELNSFRVDDLTTGIYILKVTGKSIQLSNRVFIE